MAKISVEQINQLYHDNQMCAATAGLSYSNDIDAGIRRIRRGKGFGYINTDQKPITSDEIKQKVTELVIPPAWKDVWICSDFNGHILATGHDEKGRKQYIYHPKWRQLRDLLNFYRLMLFGEKLPIIRKEVEHQFLKADIDQDQILALMVWILDNSYIRIGNETYLNENDSVGLTTLTKKNIVIEDDLIRLSFIGKSHQEHCIELHDQRAAEIISRLLEVRGQRIFKIGPRNILTADDCNQYLRNITDAEISAKNFRTWGGTLAAFSHLKKKLHADESLEKIATKAVDKAAETLGNTRAVAKSHYVHPHILETFTAGKFESYYQSIKPRRKKWLSGDETELLQFLEILFKKEFELLTSKDR